jgi:hypothetical protein
MGAEPRADESWSCMAALERERCRRSQSSWDQGVPLHARPVAVEEDHRPVSGPVEVWRGYEVRSFT